MIQIIPSINITNGKITQLKQGDYSKGTVYNDSPVDMAKRFEEAGMKKIQITDLDGILKRTPVNYHVMEAIAGYTSLQIGYSGGISTDGDISKAYEYGATTITASPVAINNKKLFFSWLISYGREKITLTADALNGKITTTMDGQQKATDIDLYKHLDYYHMRGVKYVKSTDVAKDGIEEGPNFDMYKAIIEKFPDINLIASGGVRSVDDIRHLNDIGVKGVIFSRAYYEGNLTLNDLKPLIS